MKLKRICVYPKDVQRITGRSERYGRKVIQRIKEQLGKEEHQLVSIEELADFIGLPPDDLREYIMD